MEVVKQAGLLNGEVITSDFVAPWWARNCHIQTIFPRYFQKRQTLSYRTEDLSLPDGDVLNLVWVGDVEKAKALVVLFHGLEGSIDSHYCNDLAAHLHQQGYAVVLMHFRGCAGVPNLLPRAYHSGETEDPWFVLSCLQQRFPNIPKFAIGFSLGANMLLKLLGERPEQQIITGAIAVSAPLLLDECSKSINRGFSRIYQAYLLKSMLNTLALKMENIDYQGLLNIGSGQLSKIKNFRDFDQHVTAPLHGFLNADDYYHRCSALPYLSKIATTTLIVHAKDDPFMNDKILPTKEQLSPLVRVEVSQHGGHCGFVQGSPWNPKIWLHCRVIQFIDSMITDQSNENIKE